MLASYVNESRNNWDNHLPYLCMAYWSTVHESTKFSPNKLRLGREINLPLGQPPFATSEQCYVQYVEWVKKATQRSYAVAPEHSKKAGLKQKRNYDKRVSLNQNDWVWYFYHSKGQAKVGPRMNWTILGDA